ncbi:unnamed protein product, partial [Adineta steineri]
CEYLQLQYEQQQTKDNSFQNYRLRIFWLTDSHCSDVLPILDLLLNLSQQTDIICSGISILLTIYNQVSIIFAWQLDQTLLNGNNDDLAFKQNEELIFGTLSLILQTIQKSSPHFYPFLYFLTDHAQFNVDSNLNLIPSPFIGLARSLITEYETNR